MYEIRKRFINNNRSYKKFYPIGTTAHDTGNAGATDENHFDYFNNDYRGASAHAFVDWDSITQLIPWDEQAWHAGKTANSRYIGIELCRPKTHDPVKFEEIWKRGVWLFAWIHVNVLKNTKLDSNNFISHADATMRWKQSTHMDPIAFFKEYGKTMDDFRDDVQDMINKMIGGIQVKNIVVFGNDVDRRAAEYVADSLQCPTIHKDNLTKEIINATEKIVMVGGQTKPCDKAVLVSGADRYETCKAALRFIGRL